MHYWTLFQGGDEVPVEDDDDYSDDRLVLQVSSVISFAPCCMIGFWNKKKGGPMAPVPAGPLLASALAGGDTALHGCLFLRVPVTAVLRPGAPRGLDSSLP